MYQYVKITNKVGVTIFNLKVKNLNRLIEFNQINAMNTNEFSIFRVDKVVRL